MKPVRIAVFGGNGHTGAFVARELERRDFDPVRVCRNGTGARQASCDDPDTLDRALEGAMAVINCAGPFCDTAPAVVEAALRNGIHYFDVTAEQRSARQTLATYDISAQEARVVVMPAVAFYGGLADLLASAATRGSNDVLSIEIGVALDYWHPTAGTRRTGERNTARRLVVSEGRLVPALAGSSSHWHFLEPFGLQPVASVPLSEIITISRHIPARSVRSFMTTAPLKDLADPHTPPPVATDENGRSSQRFMMDVVVKTSGATRRIAATGQDIYAVSAPIAVEACQRVLKGGMRTGGTFVAGQLFDAADFLAALSPAIQIHHPPV